MPENSEITIRPQTEGLKSTFSKLRGFELMEVYNPLNVNQPL